MSNDQNDSQSLPTGLPHGDSKMANDDSNLVSSLGHLSGTTFSPIDVQTTSLAQEFTASSSASDSSTALEFRVVRPGAPVRRLRLTGSRYTFGSGEGCSIQLDDPTLRPMHAVLLRDAHRILMRAYSVPLECNGTRVTESVLRIGDIIRMGSYRFELLATPFGNPPQSGQRQQIRPAPSRPTTLSGESVEGQLKVRLTELSQQWHARHAECEIRETRCDQRETELHSRESELWSRAENLRHRESLLNAQEAAAREIQETYAATQEELRELRTRDQEATEALQAKEAELLEKSQQLRERQAELERRQAEWKQREQEFDRRSAEAQKQLEHSQQQAEAASNAVTKMRDEFAQLNSQLTDLRERHSELQERERQEQAEHERLRSELESKYDEALEAQTQSESLTNETLRELEQVTADLESTRNELKLIREESKARQQELTERLRCTGEELQAAREETLTARKSLEEEQAYAESRIIELEESLTSAQQNRLAIEKAAESQQQKFLEKIETAERERNKAESTAEALRNSIQDLQDNVAKANEEVVQLRADKEGADASIRQLELLVDQTQNNQSAQQESWEHEAEQLRLTIEDLSIQLSSANVELNQLRSANEALTDELARAEESSEPAAPTEQAILDSETFQRLEQELVSAREEIDRLKVSHKETVSRLEAEREESESALRDEIENLRQEIVAAQESAEARIQQIISNDSVATTELSQPNLAEYSEPATDEAACDTISQESHADTCRIDTIEDETATVSSGGEVTESYAAAAIAIDTQTDQSSWDLAQPAAESTAGLSESDQSDDWSTSTWDQQASSESEHAEEASLLSGDSPAAENDQIESTVSWHDEAPENAVADTIDEIEHGVEQAIADYPDQESSALESDAIETDLAEDASLEWSEEAGPEPLAVTTDFSDSALSQSDEFEADSNALSSHVDEEAEGEAEESLVAELTTDLAESSEAELAQPSPELTSPELTSPELTSTDAEITPELPTEPELSTESEEEAPLDWTAYMPGGDVCEPTVEPEPNNEQDSWHTTDNATTSDTASEDPTTEDPADEFAEDPYETQSFTESWDSGPLPDPPITDGLGDSIESPEAIEVTGSFEATEQWSGNEDALPEPVDPLASFASEPEIESDSDFESEPVQTSETTFEQSTGGLDALVQTESSTHDDVAQEDQLAAEEEPQISSEGGLAAMLIRDLTDEGATASEDAEEPTLMMRSEVELGSIDEEESSSDWNYDSPSDNLSSESELSPPELDTLDSVDDKVGDELPLAESLSFENAEASVSQPIDPLNHDASSFSDPPEDDSIEAYMSRLLQRVQGDSAAPAPPSTTQSTAATTSSKTEETTETVVPETTDSVINETDDDNTDSELSDSTVEPAPVDNTPLVPRSQAPELSRNLSAMRELANQSARNAVARSIRIQARDTQMKAVFKAGLGLVAIAAAAGVYLFVPWSSTIKIAMVGAFVVLAAVFVQEGYVLARDAKRRLALAETGTGEDKTDHEIEQEIQRIAEEVQGH